MNKFKLLALTIASALITICNSTVACAAPVQMPDGNVFDAEFYANTYPDVEAAFGRDTALLYQHYVLQGINEGRLPYAGAASTANPAASRGTIVASPEGVTEDMAYQRLLALRESYPEGMSWTMANGYYLYRGTGCNYGAECAGYAYIINDAIFGTNPNARVITTYNPSNFHVGDIVRYITGYGSGHSVVVMQVTEDGIIVTEGNFAGTVHWGRLIPWIDLQMGFVEMYTRYNEVPYGVSTAQGLNRSNVTENLMQAKYDIFYCTDVMKYTDDPAIFFDADYYLASYPELAITVGTDYRSLFNHFINTGRFEGRSARMGIFPERSDFKIPFSDADKSVFLKWMNNRLQIIEYLGTVVNDSMSEREIVTVITNELRNRAEYAYDGVTTTYNYNMDFDYFKAGTSRFSDVDYSYNFTVMCYYLGIDSQIVVSNYWQHAWNRVKIDGIWYDNDVAAYDVFNYNGYFMIPAGTGIFSDRQPDYVFATK